MKVKFLSSILASIFVSSLASADVIESCRYELQMDQSDPVSVIEVLVEERQGNNALFGTVRFDSELRIDTQDVRIKEYEGADAQKLLEETLLGSLAEYFNIDLSAMTSVRTVTLDEEANTDDGNGAVVFAAYDKDGGLIAKVAQAGWSTGVCQ